MRKKKYLIILVLAVLLLTVFSCGKKEEGVPSKGKVTLEPKLVLEGYKGFNIISYGDKYYGLDQNEGPFYITKVEKKEYKKCFIGKSIDEVKEIIDKSLQEEGQRKAP